MATKKSRRPARGATGKTPDRMIEMMHQTWLAGLGAVAKAKRGAPEVLDDLIAEGARLQSQARGAAEKAVQSTLGDAQALISTRLAKVRGQASDTLENLEKIFQTRVHRAMTQLGVPSAEHVEALGRRVDALNASVEKLARARGRVAPRPRAAAASRSSHPAANA